MPLLVMSPKESFAFFSLFLNMSLLCFDNKPTDLPLQLDILSRNWLPRGRWLCIVHLVLHYLRALPDAGGRTNPIVVRLCDRSSSFEAPPWPSHLCSALRWHP